LDLQGTGAPTPDGEAEALSGMIGAMADQVADDLLADLPAGPATPRPRGDDLPTIRP
jgi:hypothetical protein